MSLPFVSVSFSNNKSKFQEQQAVALHVRQREYRHDVAVITMHYQGKTESKYAHGQPVVIKWGWDPDDVEYFHGYVHHTTQTDEQQKHKTLDIFCVGASYRMKQIRLKSYRHTQAWKVARQIAQDHHFSLTTELSLYVHDHLTQHGRSDWDFLVWLAKREGYTFYCTKTNLVFTKRVIDATPSKQRPTFTHTRGRYRLRQAIYGIRHSVGESTPGSTKKTHQAHGVSHRGKVVKATSKEVCHTSGTHTESKPVFTTHHVKKPVHSKAEADALLRGYADLHRFHYLATANVSGNTQVHQGSTIRLAGLDEDSDGYWYVGMIDHHLRLGHSYTMDLELGRDNLGDPGSLVHGPPVKKVTSYSGNPVLFTDCDIDVSAPAPDPPPSIYNPVDDCAPVDPDVLAGMGDNPLGDLAGSTPEPKHKTRGAARKKKVVHKKTCSCGCKKPKRPPKKVKPPKLHGWRATHTVCHLKKPVK